MSLSRFVCVSRSSIDKSFSQQSDPTFQSLEHGVRKNIKCTSQDKTVFYLQSVKHLYLCYVITNFDILYTYHSSPVLIHRVHERISRTYKSGSPSVSRQSRDRRSRVSPRTLQYSTYPMCFTLSQLIGVARLP